VGYSHCPQLDEAPLLSWRGEESEAVLCIPEVPTNVELLWMSQMVRIGRLSGTRQASDSSQPQRDDLLRSAFCFQVKGRLSPQRSPPAGIRRGTVMTLSTCTCTSDHSWSMVSTTWHSGVVSSHLFPQMFLNSSEHKLWRMPSLRPLFLSIPMSHSPVSVCPSSRATPSR